MDDFVEETRSTEPEFRKGRWFQSWRVWLVTVLAAFVLLYQGLFIWNDFRLSRQAAALTRPGVRFSYVYSTPIILQNLGDRFGMTIPWSSLPTHVQLDSIKIDEEMFESLLRLRLDGLMATDCTFDPVHLQEYINVTLPIPRYGKVDLRDCTEVPVAIVEQIEKDHPDLIFEQSGRVFSDALLRDKPGYVEVRYRGLAFPELRNGDRFLTIEDQPVECYHEIERKVERLSSGESLRIRVFGRDGFEREEIYTAP